MTGQELYEWIEAALDMGKPTCKVHTRTRLQLLWIIDPQDELITWHIYCSKCYREYRLVVGFTPTDIPED